MLADLIHVSISKCPNRPAILPSFVQTLGPCQEDLLSPQLPLWMGPLPLRSLQPQWPHFPAQRGSVD